MKSHARLVTALKTLGHPHRGSFVRAVPLRFMSSPIGAIGSIADGGRYNPIGAFEVLYLAKMPDTAVREIALVVTDPTTGIEILAPKEPQMILTVDVSLADVVDLRKTAVRNALNVTRIALFNDWEDAVHCGLRPPTHALGIAAYAAGVEALISPSTKHHGWNLNVFLDNLRRGSTVEIHAASVVFPSTTPTRFDGTR